MQIILVHNPKAGDGAQIDASELIGLLRVAGHEVRYGSSKDRHLPQLMDEPADLVVAAGGDGTIAKVATLMRGRSTPLAPLPLGTANNIATALGLTGLTLRQQIAGWARARGTGGRAPAPFKAAGRRDPRPRRWRAC